MVSEREEKNGWFKNRQDVRIEGCCQMKPLKKLVIYWQAYTVPFKRTFMGKTGFFEAIVN